MGIWLLLYVSSNGEKEEQSLIWVFTLLWEDQPK